jgi:hypothetical protein
MTNDKLRTAALADSRSAAEKRLKENHNGSDSASPVHATALIQAPFIINHLSFVIQQS